MNVILLFIDGLGIGSENPHINPCLYSASSIFNVNHHELPAGGKIYPLDACLGVEGIPQSGTGQTSLYTGINAAEKNGHHLFGFPNQLLRDLLRQHSIFSRLKSVGISCRFMNGFRPLFFTTPEIFKHMRMSATTEMNRLAGLPFASLDDVRDGKALYHDFTNDVLRGYGFKIPLYSAAEAARIIAAESKKYRVLLYEYFLTDFAGHRRDRESAVCHLSRLDALINELTGRLNFSETALIVFSDHGNIEDLGTKSHTLNPAYCAAWGLPSQARLTSLTDLAQEVLSLVGHEKI